MYVTKKYKYAKDNKTIMLRQWPKGYRRMSVSVQHEFYRCYSGGGKKGPTFNRLRFNSDFLIGVMEHGQTHMHNK